MTRTGVMLLLVSTGLGWACDRSGQTRSPMASPPAPAATIEGTGAEGISVTATAPRADEACRDARRGVAERLLGHPGWVDLVPLQWTHAPARATDAGFTCEIAIDDSEAAAILLEFEEAAPEIDAPAAWRDPLFALLAAHQAQAACARRRALFSVECEQLDTTEVDARVQDLAAGVTVMPIYEGGVPLDGQGRLLRAPGVVVMQHGVGVQGVPMVAGPKGEPGAARARTDGRGVFRVSSRGESWAAPVVVTIDSGAMLGPLAHLWPPDAVTLRGRSVDASRWRAVAVESDDLAFAQSVADKLVARGMPAPVEVPAEAETSLRTVPPTDLPVLADVLGGRLDLLLRVSVQTRFAGRASGARVWHEATGRVEVFESWTGRRLAELQITDKATGTGDAAAANAARARIVAPLVTAFLSEPAVPLAPVLRPVTQAAVGGSAIETSVARNTAEGGRGEIGTKR